MSVPFKKTQIIANTKEQTDVLPILTIGLTNIFGNKSCYGHLSLEKYIFYVLIKLLR